MPFIADEEARCEICAKRRRRSCPILTTKESFSPWFDYCSAFERKTAKERPELDEEAPVKQAPIKKTKARKPKTSAPSMEELPKEFTERPYEKVKPDGIVPKSTSCTDEPHIRFEETGKDVPLF